MPTPSLFPILMKAQDGLSVVMLATGIEIVTAGLIVEMHDDARIVNLPAILDVTLLDAPEYNVTIGPSKILVEICE